MAKRERLQPVRGVRSVWRRVYEIEHGGREWAVEVNYLDITQRVRLYRDGELIERRRSPARFELPGGALLEASKGMIGMTKLALRAGDVELPLRPAPGTLEARRAEFGRRHPTASRALAAVAWLILFVAAVVEIPQLLAMIVRALGGDFVPAIELPLEVEATILVLAVIAAIDRTLRFKRNAWLD